MTPKTIQIYLPSGDPRGIRVAEITTRIVRAIEVPRSLVGDFVVMPTAQQPGVYFLVGGDDSDEPQLYVGQSGGIGARLQQQNQSKDWWNKAIVIVSLTNSLTQTHTLFLEWTSIKEAKQAGRYQLENGNEGARPYTPDPLLADCREIQETARTLLATLGHPVFEPIAKPATETPASDIFYCKASGANGKGQYTEEGFVVLKGSVGRLENVPSIKGTAGERLRQRLLESNVMRAEGAIIVFEKDHPFKSPSMAALSLMGRTSNGWLDWKDAAGRTLDERVRQPKPMA